VLFIPLVLLVAARWRRSHRDVFHKPARGRFLLSGRFEVELDGLTNVLPGFFQGIPFGPPGRALERGAGGAAALVS